MYLPRLRDDEHYILALIRNFGHLWKISDRYHYLVCSWFKSNLVNVSV